MSARSDRVSRRAAERAHHREALDAVDPKAGGRAAHRVCLAAGCERHGPTVHYGSIVLTLCAEHKADFDRRWQIGFDQIGLAG